MYVNFNRALTKAQIEALGAAHQATNGKIYFATDDGVYVGNADGSVSLKANSGGDITSEPLSTIEDPTNAYYTKPQTDTLLSGKQNTLVSGTNIKTVDGRSILGSGDLAIPVTFGEGTASAKAIDAEISTKIEYDGYLTIYGEDTTEYKIYGDWDWFDENEKQISDVIHVGDVITTKEYGGSATVVSVEDWDTAYGGITVSNVLPGDSYWDEELEEWEYVNRLDGETLYYIGSVINNCDASGQLSFSFGKDAVASGDYSHAEGTSTESSGENSHTEGLNTIASGANSHAEGNATNAVGSNSHAEGQSTRAGGTSSHAEGWNTKANGANSHAEGYGTTASNNNSHAEGYNTTASGSYSHVEGYNVKSDGYASHAGGYSNQKDKITASGQGSFAHGYTSGSYTITASNNGAIALGTASSNNIEATGQYSLAVGGHATANNTVAIGKDTYATADGAVALGKFNRYDNNTQFSIGAGSSNTSRSNLFEINSGYVYIKGIGGYTGSNPVSGTNDLSSYLNTFGSVKTAYNMPTNFNVSNKSLQINSINNGFYAADKRATVTLTGFSSGSASSLFDGSYDTSCKIAKNTTATVLIEFDSAPGTYTYGDLYVVFYTSGYQPTLPTDTITVRVYGRARSGGAWEWYNSYTMSVYNYYNDTSILKGSCRNVYNTTKWEITITANSRELWLTQIEHAWIRGTQLMMPAVTKYAIKQDLWGDVEAPKFIKRGGTSSQFLKADGSVDSTAYTTNTGTVTSVSAGTGLSISGTASVNPTVNVASGYKLPTTNEWNAAATKEVFIIIPGTTTWQEAYNAYSTGKLVYYQRALCEYISIDGENNIEEACFSGIISDGEQAVVYHFDNKEISSVISYQSPSHVYDNNPEQVITYKQSTNELPKYEASQAEIDALFSGGGGGGSS